MKYVYGAVGFAIAMGGLFGVLFPMLISTKSTIAFLVGGAGIVVVFLAIVHVTVNFFKKQFNKESK